MRRRDISSILFASAAGSVLPAEPAQAPAPSYPTTPSETTLGVTPVSTAYPEAHLFRYLSESQIHDVQAGKMTLDLFTPVQTWLNVAAGRVAMLPKGFVRYGTTPTVANGTTIAGSGALSRLTPWGCDGLSINGDFVTLRDLQIHSFSAAGAADPKTHTGIKCNGTRRSPRANIDMETICVRGFLRGIDWRYTLTSRLDNVETLLCSVGVRLLGQTVNTTISNSRLLANGTGSACISLESDSGLRGEGLGISGSLLACADNAVKSDSLGFLSLGIDDSCIVDLIQAKAFLLTNVQAFKCSAQWVDSIDTCFYFSDLGSATRIDAEVNVGQMRCRGPVSAVKWGANNIGLQLGGNVTTLNASSGYPVAIFGSGATVTANINNANTSTQGTLVFTPGNTINPNGDRRINWEVSPVATVASAGTIALPRNGCNVFQISGSATITSINTDGWAGQEVVLVVTGSPTFAAAVANLKLAGNFAAAADDTIKLVCVGTNWYEVSRAVNCPYASALEEVPGSQKHGE
jgi:hypothetical protein